MMSGLDPRVELAHLHREFGSLGASAVSRLRRTSNWVKILLILLPAALSAVLQYSQLPKNNTTSWIQIWAIITACAAFVAGVLNLFLDHKETKTDTIASKSLALAERLDGENRSLESIKSISTNRIRRHLATHDLVRLAAQIVEHGMEAKQPIEALAPGILVVAKQKLLVALNYSNEDVWAVQIYQPRDWVEGGGKEMVCIGQVRSIECDLAHTRRFAAGIGIPGAVLATGAEKVVGDIQIGGKSSVYELPQNLRKSESDHNIRSIACVPIVSGQGKLLCGAICGTSSRPDHFSNEGEGLANVEVLRILASVLAIATIVSH